MIRCVRLWTGNDGQSHFEEGHIALAGGETGDILSAASGAASVSFRETAKGGAFDWHEAPARQLVITLSGTLVFETRSGAWFMLHAGDVLLAEDTAGGGHRWHLAGGDPWRRAYVILAQDAAIPFEQVEQKTPALPRKYRR